MSRVVPHLRGERGRVSCHSSSSLEGGCLFSAEVIKDFIQFQGLISQFSAVERFLYLRDLLNYFGLIYFKRFSKLSFEQIL